MRGTAQHHSLPGGSEGAENCLLSEREQAGRRPVAAGSEAAIIFANTTGASALPCTRRFSFPTPKLPLLPPTGQSNVLPGDRPAGEVRKLVLQKGLESLAPA